MSSTSLGLSTITSPMVSVFTPPSSCSTHWTYERESANSIPGGLLLQDAQVSHPDVPCFPTGFDGFGRAPSFIQVFSPGACPVGYTTANDNFNKGTTTAVCCPSRFIYTTDVSTVNGGDKSAEFFGCTSIYPKISGITTVFVEGTGFSSTLDGTTTVFASVLGPITMWAQPITVAFQQSDLSLFTTSTASTTTAPPTTSPTTTTPFPSRSPTSSLSGGTIAGIAIGAAAVLGLLIGAAIFLRRKRKSAPSLSGLGERQWNQHSDTQDQYWQQNRHYTDEPRPKEMHTERQQNGARREIYETRGGELMGNALNELSTHEDRRHELP